jgi:hypothetical protein
LCFSFTLWKILFLSYTIACLWVMCYRILYRSQLLLSNSAFSSEVATEETYMSLVLGPNWCLAIKFRVCGRTLAASFVKSCNFIFWSSS